MHDLRFGEIVKYKPWKHLTERVYVNLPCTHAEKSYQDNLFIMHSLAGIPGNAYFNSQRWAEANAKALERHSEHRKDPSTFSLFTEAIYHEELHKLTFEIYWNEFIKSTAAAAELAFHTTTYQAAYHLLLQSVVIQAWTAYEVLVEDLWTRIVDLRPSLRLQLSNKEWKQCGFRSTKKQRQLYKCTFRKDNADILLIFS